MHKGNELWNCCRLLLQKYERVLRQTAEQHQRQLGPSRTQGMPKEGPPQQHQGDKADKENVQLQL